MPLVSMLPVLSNPVRDLPSPNGSDGPVTAEFQQEKSALHAEDTQGPVAEATYRKFSMADIYQVQELERAGGKVGRKSTRQEHTKAAAKRRT